MHACMHAHVHVHVHMHMHVHVHVHVHVLLRQFAEYVHGPILTNNPYLSDSDENVF